MRMTHRSFFRLFIKKMLGKYNLTSSSYLIIGLTKSLQRSKELL